MGQSGKKEKRKKGTIGILQKRTKTKEAKMRRNTVGKGRGKHNEDSVNEELQREKGEET